MSTSKSAYAKQDNGEEKKKSWISSSIIHLILIILLLLPLFRFPIPPPGQQGILVSFGEPEAGAADESPKQQEIASVPSEQNKSVPQTTASATAAQSTPSPPKKEVLTTEVDPALKLEEAQKKKELEEERKRQEEIEKQRLVEEERKKAEAEKARLKAEEEARKKAEFEQKKETFGSALGQGSGSNNQTADEGDPTGKPNADALKGLTRGSGRVGGGLSGRGVLFEPEIEENSQKTGRVVIRVCVDRSGKVSSARFTQRGSTTTDTQLVGVATESVKKYIFTQSEIEEQCGTVTIEFKLK